MDVTISKPLLLGIAECLGRTGGFAAAYCNEGGGMLHHQIVALPKNAPILATAGHFHKQIQSSNCTLKTGDTVAPCPEKNFVISAGLYADYKNIGIGNPLIKKVVRCIEVNAVGKTCVEVGVTAFHSIINVIVQCFLQKPQSIAIRQLFRSVTRKAERLRNGEIT
jgi:hypothetical protein